MDKLRQSNRFALIFYLLFLFLPLALDPLCLLLFPNADPAFTLDIVFYASFPLFVGIFLLCVKARPADLGLVRTSGKNLLLGVLAGFLIQPATMLLSYLSTFLFQNVVDEAVTDVLNQPLPLILFSMALLPAFCEELVCRGAVMYYGYRKDAPRWAAVLFPALFFAALHGNFQQAIYAFAGGVVLAEIALRSDSLWPAMATHFTMNATQMVLAYISEHAPGAEDVEVIEVEAPLFDFMYVMIFAFITLVTLPLLTRCIGAMKSQRIETKPAVTELAFVPDEPVAAPKKTFPSRMAAMYVTLGLGLLLLIITEVALRAM